ncbi:MAG: histidine kinase [Actinobacteria bacterium]|nr:histidine kinase [Actinomycetota bacterium]
MNPNERVRLAQDLHDGIAQDLVGLGYRIDALIAAIGTPNDIRAELRTLRFAMSDLVEKVRGEIFELRTNSANLNSRTAFESALGYELEKIFSELLRNVETHSKATELLITVQDNGIGGALEKLGHHGLTGVRERIQNLNGVFAMESNSEGTKVVVTVPLAQL